MHPSAVDARKEARSQGRANGGRAAGGGGGETVGETAAQAGRRAGVEGVKRRAQCPLELRTLDFTCGRVLLWLEDMLPRSAGLLTPCGLVWSAHDHPRFRSLHSSIVLDVRDVTNKSPVHHI